MSETEAAPVLASAAVTEWLRAAFRAALGGGAGLEAVEAVATANPAFGDVQCNAAMSLGKALGRPPRAVAEAALRAAGEHAAVARAEVAGPGFINVTLRDEWLAAHVEQLARAPRFGAPAVGRGRTVVLDYGSPNITKPLHIGHLRSHNIGSALDRLHRFLGWRVIADNHLGDWGTQFGITIMGYRHFGDARAMAERPLEELERVYVLSHAKGEQDAAWKEQCRRELVKLQNGDAENLALWSEFVRLSVQELERLYARLGIRYDTVRGESYYRDRLAATVERLERLGLARESEGACVVFLDEEQLPPCIVRKRDGGYNYATSDLATLDSRLAEYRPEAIVYVTDERQQLHFRQVFAIARRLGCTVRLEHVWFGLMRLPEGTIKTREGNAIRLETLLDEAESRALAVVRQSSPQMAEEEQRAVARAVGIGAVKYLDLSTNPQSLVTFTWEKALALDGNSGPYLQYAFARIDSVRDKYAERFPGRDPEAAPLRFTTPVERELGLKLARFPEALQRAAELYKPNLIADFLYDLAQTYSRFYQNVPFLKAEEGVRESRVRLCGMVARALGLGLELLGLETPRRI